MTNRRSRWPAALVLTGLAVAAAGCNLDVKNPGQILDEDLNDPELMPIVAAGVSAEFSDVMEDVSFTVARLTDEMVASGSYNDTRLLRRGILRSDDTEFEYAQTHEAAWSATSAIERFRDVLGEEAEGAPITARSFLFEGLAHRVLGENFCQVTYEAGPAQPKSAAFEKAITAFNNAISHSQASESNAFRTAAQGGLAQAYVGLGDWDRAVQAAANVPTDFVYYAIYHPNENENEIFSETHDRPEMSVFRTVAGSFDPPDPRAPYTICGVFGSDGKVVETGACSHFQGASGDQTPHWRQEKYDDLGSDIPVVKGTEMRLIEAEAALVGGDLDLFANRVNAVRTFHGLDPIAVPATAGSLDNDDPNDAWSILDRERFLTLWLEGRRLWDLYRWDHPFLQGGTLWEKYEPENPRASCMPLPELECDRNPNLQCS